MREEEAGNAKMERAFVEGLLGNKYVVGGGVGVWGGGGGGGIYEGWVGCKIGLLIGFGLSTTG